MFVTTFDNVAVSRNKYILLAAISALFRGEMGQQIGGNTCSQAEYLSFTFTFQALSYFLLILKKSSAQQKNRLACWPTEDTHIIEILEEPLKKEGAYL